MNSISPSNMKQQSEAKSIEFIGNPKDAILVERHFSGKTYRDREIEELAIPKNPSWLRFVIQAIRYYQKHISHRLGNRCVYDPSCSHYSEMAFRNKGMLKGISLTIKRLYRCRPKNGGIDDII